MAITNISRNELFRLGQYKCQLITLDTTTTAAQAITNAVLKSYNGPEWSFSRVHAIFRTSNVITRVGYFNNADGRLSRVDVTSSANACISVWVIGE